jgi:hypothetical protein
MRAKEHVSTPSPFVVFTFRLVVESIKEFGGVSQMKKLQNPRIMDDDKIDMVKM